MSPSKLLFGLLLSTTLSAVAVGGVALAQDTEEAPRPECQDIPCFDMGGRVKELDSTWKEGLTLQEKLIKMEVDLAEVEPSLRAALGVATDAPMETAIADLKESAGDKLIVTLEGGKTSFSAADDAPENVKAFVAAGNEAAARLEAIAANAASMQADITRLGQEAADATGKLNASSMKSNGLKLGDLKGELAIAKHNKTATAGLKDRAARVTTESARLSSLMASLI